MKKIIGNNKGFSFLGFLFLIFVLFLIAFFSLNRVKDVYRSEFENVQKAKLAMSEYSKSVSLGVFDNVKWNDPKCEDSDHDGDGYIRCRQFGVVEGESKTFGIELYAKCPVGDYVGDKSECEEVQFPF